MFWSSAEAPGAPQAQMPPRQRSPRRRASCPPMEVWEEWCQAHASPPTLQPRRSNSSLEQGSNLGCPRCLSRRLAIAIPQAQHPAGAACRQQLLRNLCPVVDGGQMKRSVPLCILPRHVCPCLDARPHRGTLPAPHGEHERRPPLLIRRVDCRALPQQQLNNADHAACSCLGQG